MLHDCLFEVGRVTLFVRGHSSNSIVKRFETRGVERIRLRRRQSLGLLSQNLV